MITYDPKTKIISMSLNDLVRFGFDIDGFEERLADDGIHIELNRFEKIEIDLPTPFVIGEK